MAITGLFVRTRRSFAGIQLDAVLNESYSSPIELTKNPVEFGAEITDHAIIKPKKYTISGIVSNTQISLAGAIGDIVDNVSGLFGDSTGQGLTRAQSAYKSLQAIKDAREPIEVQTGLGLLENMVILDIQVNQDKSTANAIFFTAPLEEVLIVETEVLSFPASSLSGDNALQSASPTSKGVQQPQAPSASQGKSIAATLFDAF